jgi:hypothetical protein
MRRKRQTPISNHQRSSKLHPGKGASANRLELTVPSVFGASLALNESPDDSAMSKHPFDLEERTAKFGEAIVRFSKKIPRDPGNNRLIDQLVGASTSIGRNYCEANEGVSKRDFHHMISRWLKSRRRRSFSFGWLLPLNRSLPPKRANITARLRSYISFLLAFFVKLKASPYTEAGGSHDCKMEVIACMKVGNWRLMIKS